MSRYVLPKNHENLVRPFYTNDDTESFPTIKEIEHRLKVIANQEILTDKNADYFDWEQYGSLEEQRKYFSEIILNTLKR